MKYCIKVKTTGNQKLVAILFLILIKNIIYYFKYEKKKIPHCVNDVYCLLLKVCGSNTRPLTKSLIIKIPTINSELKSTSYSTTAVIVF